MTIRGPGKLIVLDGTDGTGKQTQTKFLIEHLHREGYSSFSIAFPQYGNKSAGLVEEYLAGKYGKPEEVDPRVASLFYVADRFDLAPQIRTQLAEGKIIVTDRYVDANAGHQGGKIKDLAKRKEFIRWLYEMEYVIFGIPRPDKVFILHVPAEIGQARVRGRQEQIPVSVKLDVHEGNLSHLEDAEEAYLWLVQEYPEDHVLIECVEGKKQLSPEAIHEKIWQVVQPLLAM